MVATAGVIEAGSFIGHDLEHWTVTGVNLTTAALASQVFNAIATQATIVEIGVLKVAGSQTAFTLETPNGWGETAVLAKAALEAECDKTTAIAAAVFTKVTY